MPVDRLVELMHALPPPLGLDATDFADMLEGAYRHAVSDGFAVVGDRLVVTAGVPFGTAGTTNVLRIATIGEGSGPR